MFRFGNERQAPQWSSSPLSPYPPSAFSCGMVCCRLLCRQLECHKLSSDFTVALWHKDSRRPTRRIKIPDSTRVAHPWGPAEWQETWEVRRKLFPSAALWFVQQIHFHQTVNTVTNTEVFLQQDLEMELLFPVPAEYYSQDGLWLAATPCL